MREGGRGGREKEEVFENKLKDGHALEPLIWRMGRSRLGRRCVWGEVVEGDKSF